MNQDATFRNVLLVGLLAVIPIILYHRLKARGGGEQLDRRQEGVFMLATLRPLGLMFWVGTIAYVVNPASMAWSSMPLPTWLRWTGAGVCVAVVGLLAWTLHSLGTNLTDTVVTRQAHYLITHGPYRWVRHPFYNSVALLILAICLIAANWFLLVTGAAVLSLLVLRTRVEEERLLARFGDPYRAYLRQTGRFLPIRRKT